MGPEQQIPEDIAEITIGIREQIKFLKDDIASLKQVLFDSGRDENGNKTDSVTNPPEILALLQEIREKEEQLEKLEYGGISE